MNLKSGNLLIIFLAALLFTGFSSVAAAEDTGTGVIGNSRYQYYADSLRLSFNVLRRDDAKEFTGILLQLEGSDNSLKEFLLNWNEGSGDAKIMIVNGQDIRTFDMDSLLWPVRPESIKASVVVDFQHNSSKITLSDKSVVIDNLGLSLNIGYKVSLLPKLSIRPDPNIPAIVEYSDLSVSASAPRQRHRVWLWLVGIIAVDLVLSFAVTVRNHRRHHASGPAKSSGPLQSSDSAFTVKELPAVSSIRLFGGFCVYDIKGENITKSFSPMLREILTLIIIYSADKGITSAQLKDILWPDKDLKSARNNRSVYIRKLRSLLDQVGPYTLDVDSGYWSLSSEVIFVDYFRYWSLKGRRLTYDDAQSLMSVVQGGPLLPDMTSPWLDPVKADVTDSVLESLGVFVSDPECEKKLDFALAVSDTIFRFDDLNEKALHLKCRAYALSGRHSSAKTAYDLFVQRYREIYGDSFQYDFTQLLNTPADSL